MSVLDDLIAETTLEQAKARVLSVCKAAKLSVSAWVEGDPSEQWFQVVATIYFLVAATVRDSNRAHFLELSSDPGDLDPTVDPSPGWLSAKGKSDFNTPRTQNTFASGFVTMTNGGGSTHVFGPEQLTFQNSASGKTYRNPYDPSLYLGASKAITLAPGGAVTVPVRAEEVGTASNAASGEIDTLQSSLSGVTVSNASPVLGTDRESREAYIDRCHLAAAATSPNGPADAYRYIALNTNADGSLGTPDDGKTKVNVTRVRVTKDSSYGIVNVYLASPSGPATSPDVLAVAENIKNNAVPDGVTVNVYAATGVNVTVTGTVFATAVPGLTTGAITTAASAAEVAFFSAIPVGGFDGALYVEKIGAVAVQSHPQSYNCVLTDPPSDVPLDVSEVAVLVGPTFAGVLT